MSQNRCSNTPELLLASQECLLGPYGPLVASDQDRESSTDGLHLDTSLDKLRGSSDVRRGTRQHTVYGSLVPAFDIGTAPLQGLIPSSPASEANEPQPDATFDRVWG